MKEPLVSIIVPTRNSAAFLEACLSSIANQSYTNTEIIVVDNHSSDDTQEIAARFTPHVYVQGPERTAQRNYGATRATGRYIAFIDSDMQLTHGVIGACISKFEASPNAVAVIIPEESIGEGFWAKCKALERSYYRGNDDIEAARVFTRQTFTESGGYDERLVSGEDWDLSARLRKAGKITRISQLILHNEGRLKLSHSVRKKYYYARKASAYLDLHPEVSLLKSHLGPVHRFSVFFSHPRRLTEHPGLATGMLFMKICEYAAGGLALLTDLPRTTERLLR